MKRAKTTKYLAALAALAFCLAFCGCASLGDYLSSLAPEQTEDAVPVSQTAPVETQRPPAAGQNPVFTVLSEFSGAFRKGSAGMLDAVISLEDEQAAQLYMELMDGEAALVRALWAVGMIPAAESGGGWSGSVSGAENGEGRLRESGAFTFTFGSGEKLTGSLEDPCVFRCEFNGGRTVIKLVKLSGGFMMSVSGAQSSGVAQIGADGIRFTHAEAGFDAEQGEFPEGSPVLSYSVSGAAALE